MTRTFPFHEDCYKWPRVSVLAECAGEPQAAVLNVHCLYHRTQRRFSLVGFIGVDPAEQIGQVINLADEVDAEVKVINGIGFTDEIIGRLMEAMVTTDDYPGGSFCCVSVDWPNKLQRRILRELAKMTIPNGTFFNEEKLAKRMHVPVEAVRCHLKVLADIGLVEDAP